MEGGGTNWRTRGSGGCPRQEGHAPVCVDGSVGEVWRVGVEIGVRGEAADALVKQGTLLKVWMEVWRMGVGNDR